MVDLWQTQTNLEFALSLSVLTAIFPGEPGLVGFIGAKDNGSGGDNCSCKTCKAVDQVATTNKPTPNFLQAGCRCCRSTNIVRALEVKTA